MRSFHNQVHPSPKIIGKKTLRRYKTFVNHIPVSEFSSLEIDFFCSDNQNVEPIKLTTLFSESGQELLKAFQDYFKKHHCEENLEFIRELYLLNQNTSQSPEQAFQAIQKFCEKYFGILDHGLPTKTPTDSPYVSMSPKNSDQANLTASSSKNHLLNALSENTLNTPEVQTGLISYSASTSAYRLGESELHASSTLNLHSSKLNHIAKLRRTGIVHLCDFASQNSNHILRSVFYELVIPNISRLDEALIRAVSRFYLSEYMRLVDIYKTSLPESITSMPKASASCFSFFNICHRSSPQIPGEIYWKKVVSTQKLVESIREDFQPHHTKSKIEDLLMLRKELQTLERNHIYDIDRICMLDADSRISKRLKTLLDTIIIAQNNLIHSLRSPRGKVEMSISIAKMDHSMSSLSSDASPRGRQP